MEICDAAKRRLQNALILYYNLPTAVVATKRDEENILEVQMLVKFIF